MLRRHRNIYVYNFNENSILGAQSYEKPYWRDIGDLDEYYRANMDLIGKNPSINLYNPRWEIFTRADSMQPVKYSENSKVYESLISNGCIIENAYIDRCILSYAVKVNSGASISESILMGSNTIGRDAIIKKAIIDRGIIIPDNAIIGFDREQDLKRGFTISPEGVTIIPRKYRF
jgi:glucose-1-phosphate adenylyltransferase